MFLPGFVCLSQHESPVRDNNKACQSLNWPRGMRRNLTFLLMENVTSLPDLMLCSFKRGSYANRTQTHWSRGRRPMDRHTYASVPAEWRLRSTCCDPWLLYKVFLLCNNGPTLSQPAVCLPPIVAAVVYAELRWRGGWPAFLRLLRYARGVNHHHLHPVISRWQMDEKQERLSVASSAMKDTTSDEYQKDVSTTSPRWHFETDV